MYRLLENSNSLYASFANLTSWKCLIIILTLCVSSECACKKIKTPSTKEELSFCTFALWKIKCLQISALWATTYAIVIHCSFWSISLRLRYFRWLQVWSEEHTTPTLVICVYTFHFLTYLFMNMVHLLRTLITM